MIMYGYQNNCFVYVNIDFVYRNNTVICFLRVWICFKVFIWDIMFDFGSCSNKESAVRLRFGSVLGFVRYFKFTKRVFYLQNNILVTNNYFGNMPKIHA